MGLMKTLSLSSKELKDILDRLTALESGSGGSGGSGGEIGNSSPFFEATIPAYSTVEIPMPDFVTIENYTNFIVLICNSGNIDFDESKSGKQAYLITLNSNNEPIVSITNDSEFDNRLNLSIVDKGHVITAKFLLNEGVDNLTVGGNKLPLIDTVDFTIVGVMVSKVISPDICQTISPSEIGLIVTQTLNAGKYGIGIQRTNTTDSIWVYIQYYLKKTLN